MRSRVRSRRNVIERYGAELTRVVLRFQPNTDASSLYFANVYCTFADHRAKVLGSLREHAIRARDRYNPPLHLRPCLVAHPDLERPAGRPVPEGFCAQIIWPTVHDDTAHDQGVLVLAAAQQGESR